MNILLHYAVLLSDYNKINSQRHYTHDNILPGITKHNNGIIHQNKETEVGREVVSFIVFNATFNNILVISWPSILLVEETRAPRVNQGREVRLQDKGKDKYYGKLSYLNLLQSNQQFLRIIFNL